MSSIRFFVPSFDAADAIVNPSMVTINSNSGQAMTTFSADNWKINLMISIFWNKEMVLEFLTENVLPSVYLL